MTIQEVYDAVFPIAVEVLQITSFDSTVSMSSTPEWDSLANVSLLSAIERTFSIEISPDEAYKLTSADKLVRYIQKTLGEKQ